jgi:LytS/YehU family sensor histidine kinase
LNPHFIFNILNSTQHFINIQDRISSNQYLTKVAKLIRGSFESVQKMFISLDIEIHNLQLYLELEQTRLKNKFEFEIITEGVETLSDVYIPSMILQPLVENAILHGVSSLQISGKITLHFRAIGNDLHIDITDNGIGLDHGLHVGNKAEHKSRGRRLIDKRLHSLSLLCKKNIELLYTIPYPENKEYPGNRTSILFPLDLYDVWLDSRKEIGKGNAD